MFDFLKKKIQGFTQKIKGTIEEKTKTKPQTSEIEKEAVVKEEELKSKSEDKRELKAKIGFAKKISSAFSGKIKISESEVQDFFDELELSLLEADVEQETAEELTKKMREKVVGIEISSKNNVEEFLKKIVKESLLEVMSTPKINVFEVNKKPVKILFLGPNGAGKTTSIAKIAYNLIKRGKSVVLSASDTFRAASIEQLEVHAKKIGAKIVKHNYGSDPAAVAFDAIKMAEAKGIDYVLIDTAGRQETNKNLLQELKKIVRVTNPDFKFFVGEAYSGQSLLSQVEEFDKEIGVNGFVLTKMDADAKGGTAISLLYKLKKPIVFVGVGQKYEDLLEFEPEFIVNKII